MRVYELAKKLGMENKELIPELKRLGVPVSSHSSTLDEPTVERVIEQLGGKAVSPRKAAAEEKKSRHLKGASDSTVRAGKAAAVVEESGKPEKRRILIKRKKADEELVVEDEAAPSVAQPDKPPAPSPPPAPWPSPSESGKPSELTPLEPWSRPAPDVGTPAEAQAVDQQPAATLPPHPPPLTAAPASSVAGPQDIRLEKRKGVTVTPAESAETKDRLKKVKKPGRTREQEDFREDATRWQDLRAIPIHRREDRSRHAAPSSLAEITKPRKKVIKVTTGLTIKEFAELVGQRPSDIIRRLMDTGQMLTLNQPIDPDAAVVIAENLGLKAEVSTEKHGEELLEEAVEILEEEHPEPRPPVVTIMGHVDHGKTSLLDAIRQTKVTEQEAGGITQHIGAYTVQVNGKSMTFLDTPGHEAFTAMRSRGAKLTDVVVLVVAADDGVMPQTVEAINHASAAGVPIIVAINKIDKPNANVERVKNALTEHNLIPESWGGQTIFVEVSAKQKIGLESVLEMILLQAEVMELKADPKRPAKGLVIEAKLDRGRGAVATVLVQSGTLRVGDAFVVGSFSGRVRALISDTGQKVTKAGPSTPVEVIGLPGVPSAGDQFVAVKDERVAREIAEARMQKQRTAELSAGTARVSLDDLYTKIQEGEVKELSLVIKADVQGSAEALTQAVEKLSAPAVKLRVIHRGVGGITETDVMLASSSGAIIIGFNVRPESKAANLAEQQGVDVRLYSVIYDVVGDIKAAMEGLLEPTIKERVLGRAEVRQIFSIPKIGTVAGCYVVEGTIARSNAGVRVVRDHVTVYEGKLGSLRRFKDDVREVQQGYECGMGVENFNDVKVGDILEVFVHDKVATKL